MNAYRSLLDILPGAVAESPGTYSCITERHIQALWLEQKYFKNLKTFTGLPIRVISPGIWNADAGPDFLKAHLTIGGTEVKGDIEIHLSESSWTEHKHHEDVRYNDVVLHLCLWNSSKALALKTQNGCSFYSAFLESFLTVSPHRLVSLIDLELYPYKKFLGSGRCSKQLFAKLSEQKAVNLFSDAALWRLNQKASFLKARTPNPRLWLGVGIAQALGYKRNAETFSQLYLWLNEQKIFDEETLFSLSLQICGFFSSDYQERWKKCSYYNKLLDIIPLQSDHPTLPIEILKARPHNHPVRRLAYLAKFVADPSHYLLSEKLFNMWEQFQCGKKSNDRQSKRLQALFEQIPSYPDSFFNHRYIFGGVEQNDPLSLLGQNLKRTILVNSFFPLLAEQITKRNIAQEWEDFLIFYNSLPSEKSSKTTYLRHRFFGDAPKGKLFDRADLEQGAYQVHRDFCIHYEASCDGCPFINRYQSLY